MSHIVKLILTSPFCNKDEDVFEDITAIPVG